MLFKSNGFVGPDEDGGENVIWLDREGRNISADDLRQEIRAALVNAGADPDRLYLLVNERMSENIILADTDAMIDEFSFGDYAYQFEGRGGKAILKQFCQAQNINHKEMLHGAKLLKKIRLSNSALNSPTVAAFLDDCGLNCWWF